MSARPTIVPPIAVPGPEEQEQPWQWAEARCVRIRGTFAAARPLGADDPGALARGIGEALDEVARAIGVAVRRAVAERGVGELVVGIAAICAPVRGVND